MYICASVNVCASVYIVYKCMGFMPLCVCVFMHSMCVCGVCTFVTVAVGVSVHHMGVYGICACVGVGVHMCMCAKTRGRHWVSSSIILHLILVREGLSLDLELGRQPAPAFLLSPLSWILVLQVMFRTWLGYWDIGLMQQVLLATEQTLTPDFPPFNL